MGMFRAAIVFLFVMVLAGPAGAAASPWVEGENADVRLMTSVNAVGERGYIEAALHVRLSPHWHTYWRVPGDTGLPPGFKWDLSSNIQDVTVSWPAPKRIAAFGFENYGYEDEVVFPLRITPVAIGQPVDIALDLTLLVCEEICIPENFAVALSLPAGPAMISAEASLIENAIQNLPRKGMTEALSVGRAWVEKDAVTIELRSNAEFETDPDVFLETPDFLSFGPPFYVYAEDGTAVRLTLSLNSMLPGGTLESYVRDKGITATVTSDGRALETPLVFGDPPQGSFGQGLWYIVVLAVLGGVILNLMPCVLPVLSLKLLSVVSHGGAAGGQVRAGFLASAAGIVFSFWVLAAALIALKGAGAAVGWGIQFQHPIFLTFMSLILVVFACNLWGLFDIPVPKFLAHTAPKTHEHEPTLAGHFITGAFATLLATPCTAPFLGTAIGFALARGPVEIVAVFTALGVGLSLPYLAVALVPSVARLLPKPGAWMGTLKTILGFALAITALWLLAVMAVQIGMYATGLVAVALFGVGHTLWRRKGLDTTTMKKMNMVAVIGLVLAGFLVALTAPVKTAPSKVDDFWERFDQDKIETLVEDGAVVFVDVTADWCLTCKANKKFVLDTEAVRDVLTGPGVVAMRADWTRPNPEIAAYLKSFGRYGIPFNVVYGPGAPAGMPLSELLSKDEVLDALAQVQ